MRYSLPPILQVGDVLLTSDIITEKFCCDLEACKGICCVEGDAGAPVTVEEIAELENVVEHIVDDLSPKALKVLEEQGVAYTDQEGDLVTSIVDNKDCCFTCYSPDGTCLCATERAFRAGKTSWCKPISCYLYPVREKTLSDGTVALNYHRWNVCHDAVKKGRELNLPVWKFLREPLIKRFGADWYTELEEVVAQLKEQGYLGVD
ncbi:MAG: DUF3109 family protein [Bacteroidaceae bacterium]|nr:DUF3109 family protein [Bacteroidaceae bacterium]